MPACVGGEADRGVQREIGRDLWLTGGIERQLVLQAQQQVQQHHAGQVAHKERRGVLEPSLLLVLPYAGQTIDDRLHRAQQRRQRRGLRGENALHVSAQRPHCDQQKTKQDKKLQGSGLCHDQIRLQNPA